MGFGDILRRLLDEREITQKQLATELNIAPSTIGGYVQNSSQPDFETLKRLAKYFGVSTDYLLGVNAGNASTRRENELLRIFRSLSLEQQDVYIEQGKAFIRTNHKKEAQSG